jgi:hypothetical protein
MLAGDPGTHDSHADERHAAWLQKALERWKVPRRLVGGEGRFGAIPERLGKVFLDRDELPSASSLSEEIQAALAASETLVVICSPAAVQSRWVNEEIRSFKALGKAQRVLAMIVDCEPWASDRADRADEECFPEALRYAVDDAGELTLERTELIAADLRPGKDGKQAALLKVVAGILGVGFDTLRQREAQRRQRRLVAVAAAAIVGMGVTSRPWTPGNAPSTMTPPGMPRWSRRWMQHASAYNSIPRETTQVRVVTLNPVIGI